MAAPVVEEAVGPAPPIVSPTNKKARPLWIVAAVLIAGVVAGYLAANRPLARSGSPTPTLQFSIFPPDGYALEAGSSRQTFALSPDGARLAFTAMNESGAFQTFIRDLDGHESRPLANSNYSYTVFWAPDGRSLFQTVLGSVRRSALEGDSYQVICNTPPLMLTGAVLAQNLLISGRSTSYIVPVAGGHAARGQRVVSMAPDPAGREARSVHGLRFAIGAASRAGLLRLASRKPPKIFWKPTRALRTPLRFSSPKQATFCS